MAQRQIQIPERREDEAPATAEQLARIRELTSGQSLQGYRFDYRKLGTDQANAILQQLNAMNEQQPTPAKPRKQGPGCVASFAKGTTALIFWLVVLAGVGGGGYFIYWWTQQNPKTTADTTDPNAASDEDAPPAENPANSSDNRSRPSTIFDGLGASDSPAGSTGGSPDRPEPTSPTTDPTPEPVTPPAPTVDRELTKQLADLESILVQLSQFTRNDYAADIRAQSSDAMQRRLDSFPEALAALDKADPTLSSRIRAAVDAFAAAEVDGPALREDIKSIREAIDKLK